MTRKSVIKSVVALATAATVAFSLTACGADEAEGLASKGTSADNAVKIGVVKADPYWVTFEEEAEKQGIFVDIVDLGEYDIPNKALYEGEIDLNQFQHLLFLANHNVSANQDLVPVAATAVYPLGLYSAKHESVDSITGGEVAVPSDPTNLARALLVLQDAGLIKLKDGGSAFSTDLDVLTDESKVTVVPVDAAQTAVSLPDVEAAIINNDYVGQANLTPADAIFADSPATEGARPYINIWAARSGDKDAEIISKIVEVYKSEAVQAGVAEAAGGNLVVADQTGAELESYLKDIQATVPAN